MGFQRAACSKCGMEDRTGKEMKEMLMIDGTYLDGCISYDQHRRKIDVRVEYFKPNISKREVFSVRL
jgi:hypothetical protein